MRKVFYVSIKEKLRSLGIENFVGQRDITEGHDKESVIVTW